MSSVFVVATAKGVRGTSFQDPKGNSKKFAPTHWICCKSWKHKTCTGPLYYIRNRQFQNNLYGPPCWLTTEMQVRNDPPTKKRILFATLCLLFPDSKIILTPHTISFPMNVVISRPERFEEDVSRNLLAVFISWTCVPIHSPNKSHPCHVKSPRSSHLSDTRSHFHVYTRSFLSSDRSNSLQEAPGETQYPS